ncbi:hypothetical protein ACLKA7_002037 [Drosophila subpalustris]
MKRDPTDAPRNVPSGQDTSSQQISTNVISGSHAALSSTKCEVLLPTSIVTIDSITGQPLQFRAFLDQGSQASFITESAAQQLRLPKQNSFIKINGLANARITEASTAMELSLGSVYGSKVKYKVIAYILPKQILITLSHKVSIYCLEATFTTNTQLGYIVSGKVEQYAKSISSHTIQVRRDDVSEELDNLLRKFWELEQLGEESADLSNEDKWCVDFFVSTHKRLSTGKYVVRLPILTQLNPDMVIGSSYRSALKRLSHLERRFRMDSNLENVYAQTISEYLQLHQMKPVAPEQRLGTHSGATGGVTHCYLPHHPVIKESSSTTKVRVVFDGSMRTSNGRSLNDILASGPKLHTDLPAILINWRSLKYVFMADVQMMYRCIDDNDEDAQYQRILWKRKLDEGLDEYYCSTVMFGTRSAPFLAIRVMHQLAADEGQSFPLAVDVVKQEMYVDDILSGADNFEQAENIKNQVIGMMHSGTFELRKWASNDPRMLKNIPLEHLETKGILDLQTSDGIRALGVYWTPLEDSFRFRVNFEIPVCIPTKRIILSTIARLFDPMGWLSPIVITARMLMQVLWKTKLKWDDHVPTEVQKSWDKFVKELPKIASIQIPRYITGCPTNNVGQLHIFCDASAGAYGAAAYLRVQQKMDIFTLNCCSQKARNDVLVRFHDHAGLDSKWICSAKDIRSQSNQQNTGIDRGSAVATYRFRRQSCGLAKSRNERNKTCGLRSMVARPTLVKVGSDRVA